MAGTCTAAETVSQRTRAVSAKAAITLDLGLVSGTIGPELPAAAGTGRGDRGGLVDPLGVWRPAWRLQQTAPPPPSPRRTAQQRGAEWRRRLAVDTTCRGAPGARRPDVAVSTSRSAPAPLAVRRMSRRPERRPAPALRHAALRRLGARPRRQRQRLFSWARPITLPTAPGPFEGDDAVHVAARSMLWVASRRDPPAHEFIKLWKPRRRCRVEVRWARRPTP